MNKEEIIKLLKEYAHLNQVESFALYRNDYSKNLVYVDDITIENLSDIVTGPTFLRVPEIIQKILPYMVMKDSKALTSLVSTYSGYMNQHPLVAKELLISNKELFNHFSLDNKELYYWTKNVMRDNFHIVEKLFSKVTEHKSELLSLKESISYSIDYSHILESINLYSFKAVEEQIKSTYNNLTPEHLKQLKVQTVLLGSHETEAHFSFINPQDSQLLNDFMQEFVEKIIEKKLQPISKEDLGQMLTYLSLRKDLSQKDGSRNMKI